jgi:hypothetical protein
VVLFGHNNTFSREVLRVFVALSNYLRQRDEKRYKRYYEERDLSLSEKLNHLKQTIEENRKAGYKITIDFLYNNFDHEIVNRLIESGQLIKQGNEEYVFGGF